MNGMSENSNSQIFKIHRYLLAMVTQILNYLKENQKRIFSIFLIISLIVFSFYIGGSYVSWNSEKPRVEKNLTKFSMEINRELDTDRIKPIQILDKNGILIGEFYRNNLRPIRVDNLAEHKMIVWALLSAEDREFFEHSGINFFAVFRAVIINLTRFRLSQGGSTITQQLAKLSLDLGERNLFNKLTEVYATYYLESKYSKEEILAMYLNQIFLGQENTGVESASRYYFDKSASELTPPEAAMIVGIIPAPSVYNPVVNLKFALIKQSIVLKEMAKTTDPKIRPDDKIIGSKFNILLDDSIRKFKNLYAISENPENEITTIEKDKNSKQSSSTDGNNSESNDKPKIRYSSNIGAKGYDRNFILNLAPDFNMDIRKFILDKYSDEDLEDRQIIVHTTLDYSKQKIAEQAIKEGLQNIRKDILQMAENTISKKSKKSKSSLPSKEMVKEIAAGMRGGFISLNSKNGDVEVFINNVKISNSYRANRIETSYRQPGSTIKALVYALAFEKRIVNPSTIVNDEAISYSGYSPKNWYTGYRGEITVRRAFAQSINTISVKLLKEIGVSYFLTRLSEILSLDEETMKERFAPNLSLALGSGELTPMELAIIYATIQNGGKKIVPRKILQITDSNSLDSFGSSEPEVVQILDPVACAMALDTLQSVLTKEGTMPIAIPNDQRFPMGGKTGTVQSPKEARKKWGNVEGVRDAWFAGVVPQVATVVWIGNDWGAPFPGSGSGTTGKIWWKFSQSVANQGYLGKQLLSEEIQGSYMKLDICADDGTLLEQNWEKEFLEVSQDLPSDIIPSEGNSISNSSVPISKINVLKNDKNKIKELEKPKVKNFAYCKFPLINQYYYIGDSIVRREKPIVEIDNEDIAAREGQTEIHKIEEKKENNSKPIEPFEPFQEGGVELDEPFINTPQYPNIEE
jgi:membrane peptidoglycan carboxypeptidase